jgi:carbon-monoxide dehydrogenase medium subunit
MIPELRYLERNKDGGISIGAMTLLRDVKESFFFSNGLGLIRDGAAQVSCVQIRNMATLGGNSCNASPSADTVPPLIAAGATIRVIGREGERRLPLEDFFLGPGKTALKAGELVHGFCVPPPLPRTGGAYCKHAIRGPFDLAIVGVAASVTLDDRDRMLSVRIVMAAVGPTPVRARNAEALLTGQVPTKALLIEAGRAASDAASPISDQRASAEYRRSMIGVWTRSALATALHDASSRTTWPTE